jgi:hypothetical protein
MSVLLMKKKNQTDKPFILLSLLANNDKDKHNHYCLIDNDGSRISHVSHTRY